MNTYEKTRGEGSAPSVNHRPVKRIAPAAQVSPVRQNDGHRTQHSDLALRSGIPKPSLGPKQSRRIRDRPVVDKRAQIHREKPVPVDVLVHFPVRQKVAPPQRCRSLASVARPRMPAQPQIVVPLDAQLKQLVERNVAKRFARANLRLYFVVVTLRLRKPVRAKRPARGTERSQAI